VAAIPLHTSVPIPRWPTTNVTLLGDAVHTMTPLQGLGGNTALRDASLLCRKLVEVAHGESALLPAIGAYESEMVDYGFAAVRRSLQTAQQIVSDNPVGRAVAKSVLRTAATLPPLKRLMFQDGR
jgi:2-polyprenyl-6-methoxyphenol hydroxylase-like FAD-dependent oxidoreductase